MAERRLTSTEMRIMQEALGANCITGNIRLREGEYQYSLAKAIASFQLEQYFPDVKDIINRLYGEEKTSDIQFIRKIQTILKKMERSKIVRILPKERPWDLQRYALLSFSFQDVDKNLVVFATEQQIKQAQDALRSILIQQGTSRGKLNETKIKICMLMLIVGGFYATSVWAIMQPIIDIFIFVPAISVAVASSIMLGKTLSRE